MKIYELTTAENIVLECAQEAEHVVDNVKVVEYADRAGIELTTRQATRLLSRLASLGLLERLPRGSRGWGQGWYPSYYKVKKPPT